MDSTRVGSTRRPASWTVSGSAQTLDVNTGVPQAIASKGGRPKPSYNEGKSKASAPRYKSAKSSFLVGQQRRTAFRKLNLSISLKKILVWISRDQHPDMFPQSSARVGLQQTRQIFVSFVAPDIKKVRVARLMSCALGTERRSHAVANVNDSQRSIRPIWRFPSENTPKLSVQTPPGGKQAG